MDNPSPTSSVPAPIERTLRHFRAMGREEKMQALVQYSKKLEPLPAKYEEIDRSAYTVPECQTRVDIFPEIHDGLMHFYADVNVRQSPTVAAVLAIILSAVNEQSPRVTIDIPQDFVRTLMEGIGLHAREFGLNAIVGRLRRHAMNAQAGLEF
jgi:cysteine desulfuration protein SufE